MSDDARADAPAAIACPSAIHGSRRAYTDHGCRCPETVEFMRRGWRRRRPTGRRLGTGSRPTGPDIDPIAVERAVAGDHTVRLTVAELTVAVAELTRRGQSARAIAVRLGVSDRTVTRHRALGTEFVHRLSTGLSTVALDSDDEQDAA